MTLEPPEARALAVLLSRDDALPQTTPADEGSTAVPAETAAAALADALRPHGTCTYTRVLLSGQLSAGLTPPTARAVITALTTRPGTAARGKRRGLGPGFTGITSR
jgi:hypothetical protein